MSEIVTGAAETEGAQLRTIDVDALAIGIQLAAQLATGRTLALTSSVPLSYEKKEINAVLDKLADCTERLAARYELKELERAREHEIRAQANHREQIEQTRARWAEEFYASNRKGDFKPSGAQKASLENFERTEEAQKKLIASFDLKIATLRALQEKDT